MNARDAENLAQIYHDAVWIGAGDLYDAAQRGAWAGGDAPDPARMRRKIETMGGLVAEKDGRPIGFMTIDATGLIDLAFVAPDHARKGVGAALLDAIEKEARRLGAPALHARASRASAPFFARHGFAVGAPARSHVRGQVLETFAVRKTLAPPEA